MLYCSDETTCLSNATPIYLCSRRFPNDKTKMRTGIFPRDLIVWSPYLNRTIFSCIQTDNNLFLLDQITINRFFNILSIEIFSTAVKIVHFLTLHRAIRFPYSYTLKQLSLFNPFAHNILLVVIFRNLYFTFE